MPETRRKFDQEFREGVVRIVRETGKPVTQALVISVSTSARWVTGVQRTMRGLKALTPCRLMTRPS